MRDRYESPLNSRYASDEMQRLFSPDALFHMAQALGQPCPADMRWDARFAEQIDGFPRTFRH